MHSHVTTTRILAADLAHCWLHLRLERVDRWCCRSGCIALQQLVRVMQTPMYIQGTLGNGECFDAPVDAWKLGPCVNFHVLAQSFKFSIAYWTDDWFE